MTPLPDADRVWKALADPTRRAVLDRLRSVPRTTGELCDAFPELSRTAVMKHLDLLEEAGLVVVTRAGRLRWNHLNPVPIQRICERWVDRQVAVLASSLLRLERHIEASSTPSKERKS